MPMRDSDILMNFCIKSPNPWNEVPGVGREEGNRAPAFPAAVPSSRVSRDELQLTWEKLASQHHRLSKDIINQRQLYKFKQTNLLTIINLAVFREALTKMGAKTCLAMI